MNLIRFLKLNSNFKYVDIFFYQSMIGTSIKLVSKLKTLIYPTHRPFSEIKKFENNFLSTTNLDYIESLYVKWTQDKNSVSPSFQAYFQLLQKGEDPESAFSKPPKDGQKISISSDSFHVNQQLKVRMMIQRYRTIAHQFSKVDPLGMPKDKNFVGSIDSKVLELEAFKFTQSELDSEFRHKSNRSGDPITSATPKQMKDYLDGVYCQSVGYQYTHLLDKNERDFIKHSLEQNIESLQVQQPTKQQQLKSFDRLCHDQTFIDFLGNKFGNYKRFGVEGLNSATSALEELVQTAAKSGVQNLVLGMAHRGRLNTLHCVFDKPAETIFKQFLEKAEQEDQGWSSGDVKYHLGYINKRKFGEKEINLQILPNPSHLQAVNPLVYGSVRAIQEITKDEDRLKSLGVLIHGDAAMSGQGIMYESAEMHDLHDYTTGGIIHLVMNNQIGFTTNPSQGRSSYYCTEIAKVIGVPVFHVNANDPSVLNRCIRIAVAYRQKFKKDFFIDIVGFRRYGHNEQDQPFFTQPLMYQKIKSKKTVYDEQVEKLVNKKIITLQQVQQKRNHYLKEYQQAYSKVINDRSKKIQELVDPLYKVQPCEVLTTGVKKNTLDTLFQTITTWPSDFNIHPTIKKIYEERKKNYTTNENLDWATMESLAYATLLHEGYGVRLSGQDVERGTFSHRHALISDQKNDVPKYYFLRKISPKVTISNSHLSEYGVMGFQYGYTITDPNSLTIWQAQFGDFANGATIIIDNFISSGQAKWKIQSGLVLNLPHGMDGQGPQHSSARMERFLHLSDDNCDIEQDLSYENQLQGCNLQVVCCSTTSNYFHVMRRQLHRNYRKPLIMFNSKKLLKFKAANRPVTDITEGTQFSPVYGDESGSPASGVKQVLLCDGQFYYELRSQRDELKRNDIAIVRIEQLAPFPHEHIKKTLSVYGPNTQYFWVQEQHQNYGAWNYLAPRLKKLVGKEVGFYGRGCSASTAVGMLKTHKKQEQELLNQIFS